MKGKILCIDDSTTALMLLEYALDKAGFQALLVISVSQAIQIMEEQKPDLIILDLSMPEVSGYEFLEMRRNLMIENIPVIVVSAYDSKDFVTATRNLGAVDFISKPIKIYTIIEKIKSILRT